MPSLILDGRALHYQEAGAGVPLLLLHGFPFSSDSFWPQLEAPPDGVRVLAVDLRGFGGSDAGEGPSTMEAMADDALALLDALGVPRAVVGGVSMGGYVALALARRAPSRVAALALLDTQAFPDDDEGKKKRELSAVAAESVGTASVVAGLLPRLFPEGADAAVVDRVARLMQAQSPSAVAAALRGMATRSDSHDVLRSFRGPCLVVVGERDVVTPVEKARAMAAAAPPARLEVIPGAGHLAHLERPELVGRLLGELAAAAAAELSADGPAAGATSPRG